MTMQHVTVYMDPDDAACRAAVDYLRQRGIAFEIKNTAEDPALRDELLWIGTDQLPTIVVNGVAVTGFDEQTLDEVLGL